MRARQSLGVDAAAGLRSKQITIDLFPGMDNVSRQSPYKAILNMDVTDDQKLVKRPGFDQWLALPGAHSVFTDGLDLFCIATGTASLESLWKITVDKALTEIGPIRGGGYPVSSVVLPGRIYLSSRIWNGVYDYTVLRPWGAMYSDDPSDLSDYYTSEMMLTLNAIPAPCMENLCRCGSRIWGTVGNRVYYNDPPLAYELYRPESFLEFSESLTMIAQTPEGMYFASASRTWFGIGFDPTDMPFTEIGNGALSGSLQYATTFRGLSDVPIWTARDGIYAGVGGRLVPLTKERIRFDASGPASSLYRMKDGAPQYLSRFGLPGEVGFGDSATCEIIRNGVIT